MWAPSCVHLGPILGLFGPAESGIDRKQERQIVRSTNGLDVFLPFFGYAAPSFASRRSPVRSWLAPLDNIAMSQVPNRRGTRPLYRRYLGPLVLCGPTRPSLPPPSIRVLVGAVRRAQSRLAQCGGESRGSRRSLVPSSCKRIACSCCPISDP